MIRSALVASALMAAATIGAPRPLLAQSQQDEMTAKLDEVLVTARRRQEDIQVVPIAITAISQDAITNNNMQSLGDLQYLVPSLTVTPSLSRDDLSISIRGQGLNSISGLPGVVAYLNEVPIPGDKNGALASGPGLLFDLQNVQVLKGPQGTLFGRNSVGGALLLETARPTSELEGHLQASYGNYNDRELDGAFNIPLISDVLLARVAFNGQVRRGFTQIQSEPGHPGGIDADDQDHWSARATVTFKPIDAFKNDTILTYSNHQSHGSPFVLSALNPDSSLALIPGFAAAVAQQQALGPRTVLPQAEHLASSGRLLSLSNISTLSLTDDIEFRNIAGYSEAHSVLAAQFDSSPFGLFLLPSTPVDYQTRQYTEEAQFQGQSFDKRLQWILGGFYLDALQPPDGYILQTGTLFGTLPDDALYGQKDQSRALFLQGTYDLSSWLTGLKFTAGARYSWDHRSVSQTGGLGSSCSGPVLVNCDSFVTAAGNSQAATWTVGLDYQVVQDTMVYVTSRRGYRAGGVNAVLFNNQAIPFGPEFVTDFEVGVKSDWSVAGMPMRTNAAAYYQKYRDIQVQQFIPSLGVPTPFTSNAASARLWGLELETMLKLTPELQVGANFDYLSFQYQNFGPGVDPTSLQATKTSDRPPRKFGLNVEYHRSLPAKLGDASFQANYSWTARTAFSDAASPLGEIHSYGLLNLSASWNHVGDHPVDVMLFASNVTNKLYSIGGFDLYSSVGYLAQKFGEPRMYGIRLKYRFGDAR
jgi:iron complex outermembrane receptor protein